MTGILETERMHLRKFISEDAEWLSKIYSDIDVMKYIAAGKVIPNDKVKLGIDMRIKRYADTGLWEGVIVMKETGKPAGHSGFAMLQDKSDIEIAYLLDKPYWGKGLATEIASAMLSYGFGKLGFSRVVGLVYPQNSSSIRVLEKIGMKYEKNIEFWGVNFLLYSVRNSET